MTCVQCGADFTPATGGYNARYCSGRCKNKARKARLSPERKTELRRREYDLVKADPERIERHRAQSRRAASKPRTWLAQYKLDRGCVDCGFKAHFAALQLDHTSTKSVAISDARSSVARLQQEIEAGECVVRCANCHAIKTWRNKQES